MEKETTTWPDLAIGLYDKLTGRDATISYEFDNFEVNIPKGTGSEESAKWKINGKLNIRTSEG